jgi:ATP-dependent Clp protease protease subunit
MKWYSFTAKAEKKTAELLIYGVIDDWENNARDFAAQMAAIPNDHELTVGINSRGGDVFAGYAIAGMIERRGNVVTRCDGVCASMGSVIFAAGKKRVMPSNGMTLLHDPSSYFTDGRGTAEDHRDAADDLDKVTEGMVAFYVRRSGQKAEKIKSVMKEGKFLTAQETKDLGLCDEISDAVKVESVVDLGCFRNAPKDFNPKSKTEGEPPNPQTQQKMKSLLVALAAVGLIPSADATEEVAVSAFQKNFGTIKAAADKLPDLQGKFEALQKSAAEASISAAVTAGKIKDDKDLRAKWVSSYVQNPEGTQAMLDGMEGSKPAPKGAAPVPPQKGSAKPEETATGETEESLRAQLGEEQDPVKRGLIARQLRDARGHKDLFKN